MNRCEVTNIYELSYIFSLCRFVRVTRLRCTSTSCYFDFLLIRGMGRGSFSCEYPRILSRRMGRRLNSSYTFLSEFIAFPCFSLKEVDSKHEVALVKIVIEMSREVRSQQSKNQHTESTSIILHREDSNVGRRRYQRCRGA